MKGRLSGQLDPAQPTQEQTLQETYLTVATGGRSPGRRLPATANGSDEKLATTASVR